jgi:hypothetical protein
MLPPRGGANIGAVADDDAALAGYAAALADAVDAALPRWVERSVLRLLDAAGREADRAVLDEVAEAGAVARAEVGAAVRELLSTDVDDQPTGPLALLRTAVRYPTEVLRRAGVPPVVRDEFAERAFPGDVYDLSPATWADVDPDLHEPGMAWGAAKAWVVLARRRAEGLR